MFKQIFTVLAMNFGNLRQRFWPSLVVVVGMACVVGVLLSMMSFTEGLVTSITNTGNPGNAIILSLSAQGEGGSNLPRNNYALIATKPGIAGDASGKPLAEAEIISSVTMYRRQDGLPTRMGVRGIGPQSMPLRPKFRLVQGRMLRTGARELVVGRAAQGQYAGTNLGDKVIMPDGEWPIVGVFTMGGDASEGNFLADRDTLMSVLKKTNYNSILVRLTAPSAFETFRKAVAADPTLSVTVERQPDYLQRTTGQLSAFLSAIAYTIAGIMAFGAMFGALNTMYAAVASRVREIATLRALGFGTLPVVLSVITEALVLTITGSLIGAAFAWICFDGNQKSSGSNVFNLSVSPHLIMIGILWAIVVGLIGSLLPSIRAARLPVATALRAT